MLRLPVLGFSVSGSERLKAVGVVLSLGALCFPLPGSWVSSTWAIESEAYLHTQKAITAEKAGQLQEAEAEYRIAIGLDPYDQLNYIKLASLLANLGRNNEAISLYTKAVESNAQDPMIYFSLGSLYEQQGNDTLAAEAYQKALLRHPEYRFGQFALGRVLAKLGQYDGAQTAYKTFLGAYPTHFEGRRYLAHLLLATGKAQEAVQEYETLKLNYPKKFEDHLSFAKALNQADAGERALEELKLAYAKDGDKSDILEEMGVAHERLNQPQYAVQSYEKALSINPAKRGLLLRMAGLNETLQHPELAIQEYRDFLSQPLPETPSIQMTATREALANLLLNQKQYAQAKTEYEQLLPMTTEPEKRYSFQKRIALSDQLSGQMQAAVERYESLVVTPEGQADPELQNNLAIAYHQQGNLEKALPLYRSVYEKQIAQLDGIQNQLKTERGNKTVLKQQEKDLSQKHDALGADIITVLCTLGDRQLEQRQLDAALPFFRDAQTYSTERLPLDKQLRPQLGLANVYYQRQQFDDALKAYEAVLDKEPTNKTAQLYRAKLILARENTPKNLERLEQVVSQHNQDEDAQLFLAQAYEQQGNYSGAAAQYEKVLAMKPAEGSALRDNREHLLIAYGNALQNVGEINKALETYQEALGLNPNNAVTHYNLAALRYQKADYTGALPEFQAAAEKDETMLDAYYGLGLTYLKLEQKPQALDSFERYLSQSQRLAKPGNYLKEVEAQMAWLKQQPAPQTPAAPKAVQ